MQRAEKLLEDAQIKISAVLSDVQALDYSEISTALNIALGTVKSRLSRARARMRDCLNSTAGELLPSIYRLEEETSP